MQVSDNGRKLIEAFEGLQLKAYRDAVGVWTIGYGHTAMAGKPSPHADMMISAATAGMILSEDLHSVEKGVLAAIKRPMQQHEFDAMVSLAFNIGLGTFKSSSVVRYFNRGQIELAANAFRLWTRAGGKVLPVLLRRREAERTWFLSGGADTLPLLPVESTARKLDGPHGLLQRLAARVELALAGACV